MRIMRSDTIQVILTKDDEMNLYNGKFYKQLQFIRDDSTMTCNVLNMKNMINE